jgi:23S rRNA (cytidine1920-2'-O)/16S rRNA (cytidine1409-2'-O)-methyltransferase
MANKETGKSRIDIYLVEKGFCPSRTKAQELITAGAVSIKQGLKMRPVKAASELVNEDDAFEILIQKNPYDRYVSRGGIKLEKAIKYLNLSVDGFKVLDVGISTGGFADCLLQNGVSHVLGIDVGHNQLSLKLKSDPRIALLEGVNAREIHQDERVKKMKPTDGFDLIVVDVSFISLTLVLPSVLKLLKTGGKVLALVKPQFEVGPEGLGKGGIVKDAQLFSDVEKKVKACVNSENRKVMSYFESELEGKDGNKEFFIFIS